MADNISITSGSGTTVAADDIGGVMYQRVKVAVGADGSATDVSDTNPLPIDDAGGSITVDGTVTANLSATDNAVLDAIQAAVETIDNAISGSEMQVDIVTNVEPSAITLTWATGTAATSGDNTLVAAPGASTRIVVYSLIVQNESSTATTAIVKSGSTAKLRALGQNQGDGLALNFQPGRELRCGTNEALILNLSGANSHGYTVAYATEAV